MKRHVVTQKKTTVSDNFENKLKLMFKFSVETFILVYLFIVGLAVGALEALESDNVIIKQGYVNYDKPHSQKNIPNILQRNMNDVVNRDDHIKRPCLPPSNQI